MGYWKEEAEKGAVEEENKGCVYVFDGGEEWKNGGSE